MLYLYCCNRVWEISAVGRVPALQAEGHRFESCISHHPIAFYMNTIHISCISYQSYWKKIIRENLWYSLMKGAIDQQVYDCEQSDKRANCDTREWLSGRALPCQGKCREFESRLPLQTTTFCGLFCFHTLYIVYPCFKNAIFCPFLTLLSAQLSALLVKF